MEKPAWTAPYARKHGEIQDWPSKNSRSITAPALLIIGDSNVVRPELAVVLFRMLGGRVSGDLGGLPRSQLAVLPGTTHLGVMEQTALLAIVPPFLDAPIPQAE